MTALLLTTLLSLFLVAPCSARTLTLSRALDMALRNRPSLKARQFQTESLRYKQKGALGGYLPQLRFSNATSTQKGIKGLANTAAVTIDQLVYSFANPYDLYRIAKTDTKAAQWAERAHEDLIRNEVERAFFTCWRLQQQDDQAKSKALSAKTTFEREQQRHEVNLLDRNDYLKSNVTYAQELTDASLLKQNLAIAQSELERALGRKLHASLVKDSQKAPYLKLTFDTTYLQPLEKLSFYQKHAYANRKELKILDQQIEKERRQQRFSMGSYLPSLSFFGKAARTDFESADSCESHEFGARFGWNLFDGMTKYYDAQAARARKLKSELERANAAQLIKKEVTSAYNEVVRQEKLLQVRKMSMLQATNELALRQQELSIGSIAQPDLDATQALYENAKFSLQSSRADVALAKSTLAFVCGYGDTI